MLYVLFIFEYYTFMPCQGKSVGLETTKVCVLGNNNNNNNKALFYIGFKNNKH